MTLRLPAELIDAGLAAPERRDELERVAARYAVAITPDIADLIDRADPNDPNSKIRDERSRAKADPKSAQRVVGYSRGGTFSKIPAMGVDGAFKQAAQAGGTLSSDTILASGSTDGFGWNIGGGLTYRLGESHAKIYTEARFHFAYHSGINTKVLPITFGLRW